MSNYSLTVNSTFKPFTYQELVAPVAHQQQVLDNLAEQYDKLSSQADVLEAMGKNDRDKNSGTYAKYKAYSDRLRAEAESLYRFGLNSESRQRLTDLRRMYNTEIVPIQNAWNKRDEEQKMQINARLQHPELRFTRDAMDTSLDEYIKNPQGGFGVINLNNVAAQMSEAAKTLAKQARTGRLEGIDEYTKLFVRPYGIDPNLIVDWQNDPTVSPTLTNMMNQVLAANGLNSEEFLNSPNGARILQEATSAAQRGAWSAVGEEKSQVIEDFEKRLLARTNAAIAEKQAEYAAKAAAAGAGNAGNGSMITSSYYELPMQGADYSSAGEQEDAMQTLGYTMKNGRLVYTGKTKVGNKEVSLYNSNGRIKTRQQFLQQATSDDDRKELGEYFDRMIDAGKTLGVYGSIYSNKELADQYTKLRDNNAAQMSRVLPLNYDKDAWNPTSRNFRVQEITGYRKGQPQYSSERMSLNDLLNKKDSNKNNLNIAAFWSDAPGQQGLILATEEDGKSHRYFISADSMAAESNIKEAKKFFDQANQWAQVAKQARAPREKAEAETASSTARQLAISKLHSGLTLGNSPQNQNINYSLTAKQKGLTQE